MPPKSRRSPPALSAETVYATVEKVKADLDEDHPDYIDFCDAILSIQTAISLVRDTENDAVTVASSSGEKSALQELLDRIVECMDPDPRARVSWKTSPNLKRSLQRFFKNATLEQCDSLQDAVNDWTHSHQDGVLDHEAADVPAEPATKHGRLAQINRRNRITHVTSSANGVFHNVFACCAEHQHVGHEANLLLRTYSGQSPGDDSAIAFEILFATDEGSPYHEIQIMSLCTPDTVQRPRKRLRGEEAEKLLGTLCEFLRDKAQAWRKRWRYEFHQDNAALWFKQCGPPSLLTGESRQPLPLASLLGSEWTTMSKLILAVTLAYSLHYLYDGPWVGESWSRDNILFFQVGNSVSLRPFLRSTVGQRVLVDKDASGRPPMHKTPSVLLFGVTLLEIHLGNSLESTQDRPLDSLDALLCAAQETYHANRENMNMRYRKAIQQCLNAHFGSLCTTSDDFRRQIMDNIVAPLEEELDICFGDIIDTTALDHEAAKLKISDGKPVRLDVDAMSRVSSERARQRQLEDSLVSSEEEDFLPHKSLPVQSPLTGPSTALLNSTGLQPGQKARDKGKQRARNVRFFEPADRSRSPPKDEEQPPDKIKIPKDRHTMSRPEELKEMPRDSWPSRSRLRSISPSDNGYRTVFPINATFI